MTDSNVIFLSGNSRFGFRIRRTAAFSASYDKFPMMPDAAVAQMKIATGTSANWTKPHFDALTRTSALHAIFPVFEVLLCRFLFEQAAASPARYPFGARCAADFEARSYKALWGEDG